MCTVGVNNNLWLIEAPRMDANAGVDILNDGSFTFFCEMGGVVGPHWGQYKSWRFCT